MRLVSYRANADEGWRAGCVRDDRLVDGAEFGWPSSVKELLRGDPALIAKARDGWAAAADSAGVPLGSVQLGPAIPDPDKIWCAGINYYSHADEFDSTLPSAPDFFAKFRNTLIGTGMPIVAPRATTQVDYEGELAVVIGRRCARVTEEAALGYVAGYAVFNDVSARDLQTRTSQWTAGKSVDTFGPLGPGITPSDEVPDPQDLAIQTRVNGELRQDASTRDMRFSVAQLVSYLSGFATLEPGDLIATGTPSGVGLSYSPPRFLQPGDVVEVTIEKLGSIRNTVTAE